MPTPIGVHLYVSTPQAITQNKQQFLTGSEKGLFSDFLLALLPLQQFTNPISHSPMTSLNRISKSGSDWSIHDLDAYNIKIQLEDRATFFGDSNLPLPMIDEELLTTLKAEDMLSDHNAEIIHLLDLAMCHVSAGESAVNDFTVGLLRQLNYVKRNRIAHTQMNIPFLVAREWRDTINDICLLDGLHSRYILLLIQEVKHLQQEDQCDPSASLIAKAIGAFDYNNREQLLRGKATIASKVCGFVFCIFHFTHL